MLGHLWHHRRRLGVPICASMEVIEVGRTPRGIPVLVDKIAADADWVAVINRIKPHTEFSGDIESGLMKMMAIGFGNHRGALNTHQYAVKYGYRVGHPRDWHRDLGSASRPLRSRHHRERLRPDGQRSGHAP